MDSNTWSDTYLDNLMLRGLPLANRCCMCCSNEEIVDHLLLHYPVAHSLWVQMLQVFGIQWIVPGSAGSLVFCWINWLGKFSLDIWFLAVWCGLFGWKEIGALLRLKRNRLFGYKLYARVLFLIGLGAGVLQIVLLFWSFLLPLWSSQHQWIHIIFHL